LWCSDLDIVKLLLKHGANPYATGHLGHIAMEEVRGRQGKNAEAIRQFLGERYPDCQKYLGRTKKK
jgi:hypothetical protein